jgi:hypothetical protein
MVNQRENSMAMRLAGLEPANPGRNLVHSRPGSPFTLPAIYSCNR